MECLMRRLIILNPALNAVPLASFVPTAAQLLILADKPAPQTFPQILFRSIGSRLLEYLSA
jgi:hypothetical protein